MFSTSDNLPYRRIGSWIGPHALDNAKRHASRQKTRSAITDQGQRQADYGQKTDINPDMDESLGGQQYNKAASKKTRKIILGDQRRLSQAPQQPKI